MSDDDKSRKTEKPTPKKLRDARKKGQVVRSKEVVSTALLITTFLYLSMTWDWQVDHAKQLVLMPTRVYEFDFPDALKYLLDLVVAEVWTLVIPILAVVTVTGIFANLGQFGVLFAAEPLKPNFNKLNPVSGMKRLFSGKHLMETLLSVLKLIGISALLYWIIMNSLGELVHDVRSCDVLCLKAVMEVLLWRLMVYLLPLLILLAGIDYVVQRAEFMKEQRMTKDEVRREYKDTEGDPQIKGQRRRQQRESAMNDVRQRIKTARVLITDVNAVAIALRYDQGSTPLPLVVAIGKGNMARQMIAVADAERIPVVDDPALVELILDGGKIDQYIPSEAVEPAAKVIRQATAAAAR